MNKRWIVKLTSILCAGTVVFSFVGTLSIPMKVSAENVIDLRSEYDSLEQRRNEINKDLETAKDTVDAQREKQDNIEEKISLTQRQIAILSTDITNTNSDIVNKQELIKQKQKNVEDAYELYKQRVRAAYMSSDPSMVGIILGAEDISDFIMRMEMIQRVSKHDQKIIGKLKKSIEQLKIAQKELEKDKTQLADSKSKLSEKQSDLNGAFSQSESQMMTKEQEFEYHKKNKSAIEKQMAIADEEIKAELAAAKRMREEAARKREEERKRQEEEEEKKQQEQEKEQGGNSSNTSSGDKKPSKPDKEPETDPEPEEKPSSGKFAWPMPGYYTNSDYGWRTWPDGSKEFHKGIDISGANIYGKRIIAAESGYVLRAFDNGNGYGIHVLIDHGDYKGSGLASLYGHMSRTVVSIGDYVKRGQTIGYVGSTGMSTGPHLHFEVRVDGTATNPMPYLS